MRTIILTFTIALIIANVIAVFMYARTVYIARQEVKRFKKR